MADEPENLTLKLLRELRSEMREGFEKAFGELADLRGSVSELHRSVSRLEGSVFKLEEGVSELQHEVAAMRIDQGRTNELLEQVHKTQQNHGARLNVIDGRLAIIEERTGLVKA